MTIDDSIYGKIKITEPILVELIESVPVQRLKKIHQHGANYFYWPAANKANRYDHSLGVMLLIRKLGGSLKEQVAGLLHDVAHSAFSHVLDYLVENRAHEAHEKFTTHYVVNSDIPAILRKYNFDPVEIFDHYKFTILEQPSPALCADRVDYFLRDGLTYGVLTKNEIETILEKLSVHQGIIVVKDKKVARLLGETYLELDREYWATSKISLAVNYAIVEILKRAMGLGFISFDDLWSTDEKLIQLVKSFDDSLINKWFNVLNPESIIIEDKDRYDVRVWPKIRVVDPPVLVKNRVVPLSSIDKSYNQILAEAKKFPKELYLRFDQ